MELKLRTFNDSDISLLRKWLCEKHVAKWFEHPEDWLYEVENRDSEFSWISHFIVECGVKPIGFCQFYEYCRGGEAWHGDIDTNGAYSMDYLIGNVNFTGKGFGKGIILLLLEQISACHNARLVIVKPDEENKSSSGALLSAGFVFDEANQLFRIDLKSE